MVVSVSNCWTRFAIELTAFTRTDEMAAVGAETTLKAISKLRELLHRLDRELFPLPDVNKTPSRQQS